MMKYIHYKIPSKGVKTPRKVKKLMYGTRRMKKKRGMYFYWGYNVPTSPSIVDDLRAMGLQISVAPRTIKPFVRPTKDDWKQAVKYSKR